MSELQVAKLDALLLAFAQACDYANREAPPKLTNQIAMQSLLYSQIRAYYGLSANLAIQAIRRVCANRKTAKQKGKPVKSFAPTSASYDAPILLLEGEVLERDANLVGRTRAVRACYRQLPAGNAQGHQADECHSG